MPRLSRLDAPGVLHHVIGRGIERRKIFFNENDYDDFIERLAEAAQEGVGVFGSGDCALSWSDELMHYPCSVVFREARRCGISHP